MEKCYPFTNTCDAARPPFLRVSGIYPHLAMWNHPAHEDHPWFVQPECGIGAVIPWAGKLWTMTYTSHALGQGSDQLFAVSPDKTIEIRPESAGGTHACRMIHRESKQLFIGCYAIDAAGRVRVIARDKMPGRLSAIATHLTDPANKIYYYTQECSLFEVDVHTLEPTLLFHKATPGWHSKGAYTAQGVLVVSHNGEEPGPSPYWSVDYTDLPKTNREVERFLKTPVTHGPEDWGVLAEWDGREWRVISRRQHVEIMGPGDLRGAEHPHSDEPIWATGWDTRSVLLHVRHAGQWKTYRLPKGSYSYDGFNGSYTEWPRIREVGDGRGGERRLMTMHGTFYEFPAGFRPGQTGGLRPLCTYQRYIPDFCRWGDELVLAGQDASRHGVQWAQAGHSHSNLQFLPTDELGTFGPPTGWGGPWKNDRVTAELPSEPFHVLGYAGLCLHLAHTGGQAVTFTLEVDAQGDDQWSILHLIDVPVHGYRPLQLELDETSAQWMRLRVNRDTTATAYFHLFTRRSFLPGESALFDGLAPADGQGAWSGGLLRIPSHTHNLGFLAQTVGPDGTVSVQIYHEINERLEFTQLADAALANDVRQHSAIVSQVSEDRMSLVAIGADGRRFRLPKASHAFWHDHRMAAPRDVREVVQERYLANLSGTFFEVPRLGVAKPNEQRDLPDYSRMKPIASHDALITDFTIWRGLLVLAGINSEAAPDGHIFLSAEKPGVGLWFGAFDDLWRLGKPVGVGGPWQDTATRVGEPSDPYLMTGYDAKTLRLSHRSRCPARYRVEVDFTGDGSFHLYQELTVEAKGSVEHVFPAGFHAHWVRLVPSHATIATAHFIYA